MNCFPTFLKLVTVVTLAGTLGACAKKENKDYSQAQSQNSVKSTLAIVSQPQDTSINSGDRLKLSVYVNASSDPSYLWMKDGSVIEGQTLRELMIESAAPSDAGTYVVKVSLEDGTSVTSNSAYVSVAAAMVTPTVEITSQPMSQEVKVGEPVNLSVGALASDPNLTLSYVWQKNGMELPGEIMPTLAIAKFAEGHIGDYRVIVTAGGASAVSSIANLKALSATVNNNSMPPVANNDDDEEEKPEQEQEQEQNQQEPDEVTVTGTPTVFSQPLASRPAEHLQKAVLQVVLKSADGLAYQWKRVKIPAGKKAEGAATALLDTNNISGAKTDALTFRSLNDDDFNYRYYLVVSGKSGEEKLRLGPFIFTPILEKISSLGSKCYKGKKKCRPNQETASAICRERLKDVNAVAKSFKSEVSKGGNDDSYAKFAGKTAQVYNSALGLMEITGGAWKVDNSCSTCLVEDQGRHLSSVTCIK